jgi:threonine/homoserine/homoserine lactone efflux protein
MAALIITSIALGIAYCAPPGVVTAEAIRRGLARGFWAALWVELGSLIGDAAWAAGALLGFSLLLQQPLLRVGLGALGVGLLFYLALTAFRDARRVELPQAGAARSGRDFGTGVFLSLTNPFAIAFWLGVGGSTVVTFFAEPQAIHYAVYLVSFLLGGLLWAFFLAALIAWGQRLMNPRFFRIVNLMCGIGFVFFDLRLLLKIV